MNLTHTAEKAIESYGGIDLWQNAKSIEAEVSVKGLAFTLKQRPVFDHAKIKMAVEKPFSRLTPIGKKKQISGVLDGHDVRLENSEGETIKKRDMARQYFTFGRRLFYWDDLDMAYFANYAFWNYFTLPRLLITEDIKWMEKPGNILEAKFPKNLPTHNALQEFCFDKKSGLLIQHNYTPDIISRFATAANVVAGHSINEELTYPDSRIVTPRNKKGVALKGPVLINIKVHRFKLSNKEYYYDKESYLKRNI